MGIDRLEGVYPAVTHDPQRGFVLDAERNINLYRGNAPHTGVVFDDIHDEALAVIGLYHVNHEARSADIEIKQVESFKVDGELIGSAVPHLLEEAGVDHVELVKERDTDLDESVIILAHFSAKSERVFELDREQPAQPALLAAA